MPGSLWTCLLACRRCSSTHRTQSASEGEVRSPTCTLATSLFGLVFCSVRTSDWAKDWVKHWANRLVLVRTESKVNLNYSDSVQMNLHARDRLIPYRLTFVERKTTSFFRLVQTNQVAKKSGLSPWRYHYWLSFFIYYVATYAVRVLAQCLVEAQSSK